MQEARKYPRQKTPPNLVAFEQIAMRGYGDLQDISRGGMRMRTAASMKQGPITAAFKLPPGKKPLVAEGNVVWVAEQPEKVFDLGIVFESPGDELTEAIQGFFALTEG